MYKILLHIGLPKTATSSLQENVLYQAHKDGKINFLGRCGEIYSDHYFFPLLENLAAFSFDKNIEGKELFAIQNELKALLKKDKLNVISEECLSLTYKKHYTRLINIQRLLSFCDVDVLLSLRQPADFFLSYYAEMYKWKFHKAKQLNDINKFIDCMMKDKSNLDYDILFYDRFVEKVTTSFQKVKIILYEDLLYDKKMYFEEVSNILNLEQHYVESLFMEKKRNVKGHYGEVKVSMSVTLDQYFAKIAGYLPFNKTFMSAMKKIVLKQQKKHVIDGEQRFEFLKTGLLLEKSGFLFNEYEGLRERLIQYGYMRG